MRQGILDYITANKGKIKRETLPKRFASPGECLRTLSFLPIIPRFNTRPAGGADARKEEKQSKKWQSRERKIDAKLSISPHKTRTIRESRRGSGARR